MTSKEMLKKEQEMQSAPPFIKEMTLKGKVRAKERMGIDGWEIYCERIGVIVKIEIIDNVAEADEIVEVLKDIFQRTIQSFQQFC